MLNLPETKWNHFQLKKNTWFIVAQVNKWYEQIKRLVKKLLLLILVLWIAIATYQYIGEKLCVVWLIF